ncbi:MAG: HYR domain-containing protein [Planctomycetota bacterium]
MKTSPLAFLVFVIHLVAVTTFVGAQCDPAVDCNGNGVLDSCDIADHNSDDCDGDGIPDECQISSDPSLDCNQDLILDACESSLEQILDGAGSDYGKALDMTSNWLALGAPNHSTGGNSVGAVHLYRNIGSSWVSAGMLQAPAISAGADYGFSVAITDDLLVVGAPGSNSGEGAAYIYRRSGLNWILEQVLEPAGTNTDAEFGISVDVDGERVAVGAWYALTTSDSGSVYLYSNDGNGWNLDQLIESPDSSGEKHFGASIELSGDFVAVSDPRADAGPIDDAGAVYIYRAFNASLWAFSQKIISSTPVDGGKFGYSIDMQNDQLLVGAPDSGTDARGEAHLFTLSGSIFSFEIAFTGLSSNSNLGQDVAVADGGLAAGAWRGNGNKGQVLVFQKDANGTYQFESFDPQGAQSGDRFGERVAAGGRWIAGASLVDSYVTLDRLIDLPDCDENGVDDPCDIFLGNSQDCNQDGKPDSCQIADGEVSDCNLDGIPDSCQLDDGSEPDCNLNGVIDSCDIDFGTSDDCNQNQIPDDCESDCNQNNIEDSCEIAAGTASDCNSNGLLDVCDLSAGNDTDCNNNSILDGCEIADGTATDCDENGTLDVCDILFDFTNDCNSNQILDSCEIANGTAFDCNNNNTPDICDVAFGVSPDCDNDLIPDECELQDGSEPDCNGNNIPDSCDILAQIEQDCEGNGIPDSCDVANGALDCNENNVPDVCEVDVDTQLPTFAGLSGDLSISALEASCEAPATWAEPTVTDDCGVASVVSSHAAGDSFPVGDTLVTYTATDVSGNVNTASFTVTITDDQAPSIANGPTDISVSNEAGTCQAVVTWDEPSAADNCGIADLTSDHSATDSFPVGTTTVTYTATDVNGNQTTHSFNVTVSDDDLPAIHGLPGPVFVNSNPGFCTAAVSWPEPTFSDNCDAVTVEVNHQSGSAFSVGVTLVTYTVTDAAGNTADASFELTVLDNELPTITNVPADVVLNNDEDLCGAAYVWEEPALSDNCGAPALTSSLQSGHVFPVGTTFVSLSVDDGNSNLVETGFTVTVVDNTAPLISRMPADIVIEADQGGCDTLVEWEEPEAADNCGVSTLVANNVPGIYAVGTTEVVYTAQDIHGNITLESFTVTVLDSQAPELTGLPVDLSTDNLLGLCGANLAWPAPSAADNCGVASIESTHSPGDEFPVGTTTVIYTVTDINGNETNESFLVTIHDVDTPEIDNMPADITSTNDEGACGALVSWAEPVAWDNCEVIELVSSHENGGFFPVGTTTVTYTAKDDSNLEYSETFLVTVTDDEAPVLIGLAEQVTFSNVEGLCSGLATWDLPSASDNCQVSEITSTHEPGWSFNVGSTLVTYTVTDIHGNSSEETIIVIIEDTEAPTFVSIPEEIQATTEPGLCTTIVDWEIPVAADNCAIFSLSTSNLRGTEFGVGVTTVTYTATDIHGNSTDQSFVIIVTDDEMPVIAPVPEIIEVNTDPGQCNAIVHWEDAFATDNCGILSYEATHQSGETFDLGTTTVTLTTTDVHFNVTTETFDVVVTDAEAAEFTSFPENIQLIAEPGLCSAMANWDAATASDNCGVASIVSNRQPGEHFDVGTTEVTFTLTDVNGNVTEDSILITVEDLELPVITNLPPRVTVGTEPGTCMGTTSWTAPDVSDNCAVDTLVASVESGTMLPIGETAVTYTVTDINGNSSSQSFIVTVEDQELPQILNVPADITQTNDAGACGAVIMWDAAEALDNCQVADFASSHNSGDFFPVGTTTVTLTATDTTGNSHSESFEITVTDDENPILSGVSGDLVIDSDLGECGAMVTWNDPSATDNCGDLTITTSHEPGAFFEVGTTLVTYQAVDQYGNMTSQEYTVTVHDVENPQISSMPADIQQNTDPGICGAVVEWMLPESSDNCAVESLVSDYQSGETFPEGTTTVTYIVTDIHGNSSTESFMITVSDAEAPEFTSVPASISVNNDLGECGAIVEWSAPQAQDNCDVAGITLSHQSGDQFPVGETLVSLTVTDIHGNSTDDSFTVTVTDNESPVITNIPDNITLTNDPGDCGAVVTWAEPNAVDNCQISTFEPSLPSGTFFEVGVNVVTYTAVDIHGNFSSENFVVTVNDNESPALNNMPADITLNSEAGLCSAVVTWAEPQPSDNCAIDASGSSHLPGDTFLVGTTEVTYSTTDIHGNSISASFNVTVLDEEMPMITDMPASRQLQTDPGQCGAMAQWTEPSSTDNCQVDTFVSSHNSGDIFPVGDTTVTYTSTDIHGNQSSESFVVTVDDNENPQISGLSLNLTLDNDAGECAAVATWTEPSASDNCDIQSFTSSHASGESFPVGSTTVSYTALDIHGNETTESFSVTVLDTENPVIQGLSGDLASTNDPGACGALITWTEPTAEDNCSIESLTSTHNSGDFFEVGTTTVTYTALDIHGNELSGSFNVTISDDENPEILGLSGDIVSTNDAGDCGALINWAEPTAADNCSIDSLTSTHTSGDFFEVGTTTVTYTAMDNHGNMISGSFDVTINDDEAPVLADVPTDMVLKNEQGQCGSVATWINPSASDNCGVTLDQQSHDSGAFFPVGTTTVSFNIEDEAGNSASASFQITVLDDENPSITGLSGDITVNNTPGECTAEVTWAMPNANDNCGIASFELSHESGTAFPVGTTLVTALATDEAGNSTEGSFEVTVLDNENPAILNLSNDITVPNDIRECGAEVTWSQHIAVDNCGSAEVNVSHASGDVFPVGETVVTVTATDGAGNEISGSFTVTVIDNEDPRLLGMPNDISLENDQGECGAIATWSAFGTVDNCPGAALEISHASGSLFPVGQTEVVLTLTDVAGNQVVESFTVTVEDTEAPAIAAPATISVDATPESCDATIVVSGPEVADNCEVASVINSYTGASDADGTYPLGDTVITWTVTDIHGNESSAEQLITVNVDQTDCNANGTPDVCEIASGAASDCNSNGIPDECEADCNGNGTPDDCDIASGSSLDTNGNGTPDECETQFIRGDANANGAVDVTDPIYILMYINGSGPDPSCLESANVNHGLDSFEKVDITDVIYLLNYLFLASDAPAEPFASCGIEPDGVTIGCDSHSSCP